MRRAIAVSLAAVSLGAFASACATSAPAHRGAGAAVIHDAVTRVLESSGYECRPSPDKSWQDCAHPERTDISFAYLPQSNLLQLWTRFSRDDDGLTAKWRRGSCEPLHADIAEINATNVLKLVCEEASIRFELSAWVPENGFLPEDLDGLFDLYRIAIGEIIQSGGFLPPKGDATALAPTDT